MKKRKTVFIILGSIILFLIISAGGFSIYEEIRSSRFSLPPIAFMYNSTLDDCIFICSDGRIFQAISEEAFYMPLGELSKRIEADNYEELLVYKKTINNQRIQRMYRLYAKVVLKRSYTLYDIERKQPIPNVERDNFSSAFWYGVYESEGELWTKKIYTTSGKKICSDIRAYIIVNWINEVLAGYK